MSISDDKIINSIFFPFSIGLCHARISASTEIVLILALQFGYKNMALSDLGPACPVSPRSGQAPGGCLPLAAAPTCPPGWVEE